MEGPDPLITGFPPNCTATYSSPASLTLWGIVGRKERDFLQGNGPLPPTRPQDQLGSGHPFGYALKNGPSEYGIALKTWQPATRRTHCPCRVVPEARCRELRTTRTFLQRQCSHLKHSLIAELLSLKTDQPVQHRSCTEAAHSLRALIEHSITES